MGSPRSRHQQILSGGGSFLYVLIFAITLYVRRMKDLSRAYFIGTNHIHMNNALKMLSIFQSATSKHHHIGNQISPWECWRDASIRSITSLSFPEGFNQWIPLLYFWRYNIRGEIRQPHIVFYIEIYYNKVITCFSVKWTSLSF